MEETLINRTMPNSREAEQSVIGSMIMDKDAILTAMEMLISEDFYYKQYGILFDTMIELYSKGLPVDLVTLQNKLKEKDVPAEIASLEFVRDLLNAVPPRQRLHQAPALPRQRGSEGPWRPSRPPPSSCPAPG